MNNQIPGQSQKFDSCYLLFLFIFLFFFLSLEPLGLFSPWINPNLHTGFYSITQIDPADDSSWYAYLRSMVIDGDIDFFNEVGYRSRYMLTATGYSNNWPYAFGNSILWLPYFLLGHFIAWIYQFFGYSCLMNGFSPPYHVLTGIGSATNTLLGIFLLYLILRRYFSQRASFLAVTLVCFSSFLPFYAFIRSRMAHANEFLAIVSFLYLWVVIQEGRQSKKYYLLLGISAGVLAAVRLNDSALIIIFLCGWGWNSWVDMKSGKKSIKENLHNLFIFLIPVFIIIFPVMLISKILFNNYFSLENAKQTSDSALALSSSVSSLINWFSNFRLVPLLVSADKGLLFSSPALLAGFFGFFLFIKKHRFIGIVFLSGFLVNLLQVITFFSFGVEFGTRYLTPSLPFFAFGLAALMDQFKSKLAFPAFSFMAVLLIFWQYIQLAQYKVLMRWDDPDFLIKSFQNIPMLFSDGASFLLRSTSWFNIVSQKNLQLNNYVDYFFIIFTPLIQLLIPLAILLFSMLIYKYFSSNAALIEKAVSAVVSLLLLFFLSLPVALYIGNPPKSEEEIASRHNIVEMRKTRKNVFKKMEQRLQQR